MRNRRGKLLLLIFSMVAVVFIFGCNTLINKYLPSEIKLMVNEEKDFGFNLPIDAKLNGDIEGVLEINKEPVKDNIVLDLNDPFTIESNDTGQIDVELKLFGILPIKTMKIDVIPEQRIAPAGLTVGVTVNTDGIMVLGTGEVYGEDGKKYSPAKGKLHTGDYILKVNDQTITNKDELIEIVNVNKDNPLKLNILRSGDPTTVYLNPIKALDSEDYRLGVWVRDDTQGIGTLTYINFEDKTFGALGHGITDVDTKKLINIKQGEIVNVMITTVKKGQNGIPGEISGIIVGGEENELGKVKLNTNNGIFGGITTEGEKKISEDGILPIGFRYDIHEGEAIVRSDVSGELKDYKIEIKKIYLGDKANKGMVIEVVDKELLSKTNGIIQGMSGSPIIQDGKLIGAVTHVFVQDSTRGYGTFIENMLIEEKGL